MTRSLVDVDLDGSTGTTDDQLDDAVLLTVGLSNLDVRLGTATAGLHITGGTIGIAALRAPLPADGTDTRRWIALKARASPPR